MINVRRLGQLGLLAVGVGIASAMAAPGVAWADNSQVGSSIDPSVLLPAADPAQSSDFQISMDGMDLLPTAGNTATAYSGAGDIAIAYGDGAQAIARGGTGDYASANGAGAFAEAGDGGAGASGNNFDYASASGTGAVAQAGNDANSEFADASTGNSFDYASASGTKATSFSGFEGSYDYASSSGNLSNTNAGDNGNGDFASAVGGNTDAEAGESGLTAPANHDTAIVLGSQVAANPALAQSVAGGGFSPTGAIGDGGSNDTSITIDPLDVVGSHAVSGLGNNFDYAAALADGYIANAFTTSDMVTVLP